MYVHIMNMWCMQRRREKGAQDVRKVVRLTWLCHGLREGRGGGAAEGAPQQRQALRHGRPGVARRGGPVGAEGGLRGGLHLQTEINTGSQGKGCT